MKGSWILMALIGTMVLLLESCPPPPSFPLERYVSPAGNDGNPGTLEKPWASLSHAASSAEPGMTVYLRAGTYHEQLAVKVSGKEGAPIVFKAYPGETPAIDGDGLSLQRAGLVSLFEVSYISLSGLKIINAPTWGMHLWAVSHVTVKDCTISHTGGAGILTSGHNVTLRHNEISSANLDTAEFAAIWAQVYIFEISDNQVYDCKSHGIVMGPGCTKGSAHGNNVHDLTDGGGIDVGSGSHATAGVEVYDNSTYRSLFGIRIIVGNTATLSDVNVHNNVAYSNTWCGYSIGAQDQGAATYPLQNVELNANIARDNPQGVNIQVSAGLQASGVRLFNNLIYNNTIVGLNVLDTDSAVTNPGTSLLSGLLTVNNTFSGNGAAGGDGGGIYIASGNLDGAVVRNNIVQNSSSYSISVAPTVPTGAATVDHNLVQGFNANSGTGETLGTDSVTGDPLFVDEQGEDFHLLTGSPAIDAGSATNAPANDFEGTERPQGAGTDIGAYEQEL